MGNIYASESLFRARISPTGEVTDICEDEYDTLAKKIQETMKDAIENDGISLGDRVSDWESPGRVRGKFQDCLSVYGKKAGAKCAECNGTIEKSKIDGRMTYYCETCRS